jgi:hypothetical protein
MLPYTPIAWGNPIPAFESSVLSCCTTPVGDAITLTLQNRVVAVPQPRSVRMSVSAVSCQMYEVWPLFILKELVGGPNWTTITSTFYPIN